MNTLQNLLSKKNNHVCMYVCISLHQGHLILLFICMLCCKYLRTTKIFTLQISYTSTTCNYNHTFCRISYFNKPVNHTVHPRKPRRFPRIWPLLSRDTWCFCSVTFVATCRVCKRQTDQSKAQLLPKNVLGGQTLTKLKLCKTKFRMAMQQLRQAQFISQVNPCQT
jgi:hypothetical protein